MIEQELLLLGLLKEGPKHGYDIKIKIKEILYLFAGVDLKSIYYPLRILEEKGFVTKEIRKAGRRPTRLVYTLTPKGESRFEELLTKSFLNFRRPQFTLDLSLYFLHYMKSHIVRRRLRARMQILQRISKGLEQMVSAMSKNKSSSLIRILEHNLKMLEAESNFLRDIIKTL